MSTPDFSVGKSSMMRRGMTLFVASWFALMPIWPVFAEDSVDDIQNDIEKVQKKLEQATKQKAALEKNLSRINQSIATTVSAIAKTQAAIRQTENTIERKGLEIQLLEQQVDLKTQIIAELIQDMYFNGTLPDVRAVLDDGDFSTVLDQGTQYSDFHDRMNGLVDDLQGLKSQTEIEKTNLENLKAQHEDTLQAKVEVKQELASDQATTQQSLAEQQKTISRLKKELSELQGDLSKILGKSYNAKDIEEAVSFASEETGVPKGFLFGVLKMETNLGANVGGCTYAEVEEGAQANYKAGKLSKRSWNTFQYRRTLFKQITDELDIDYKKQKVSCNPRGYTGTGGAMGVAQFMSDTWMGYKSGVSSLTGHRPPSPWDLTDGVSAMALKLKKTPGVTDGKKSALKSAACSYLGTCYAPYINGILYWADNYKQLLD